MARKPDAPPEVLESSHLDDVLLTVRLSNGVVTTNYRGKAHVITEPIAGGYKAMDPNVSILCVARGKTRKSAIARLSRLRAVMRYELALGEPIQPQYGYLRNYAPKPRAGLEDELAEALETYTESAQTSDVILAADDQPGSTF